MPSSRRCGPRSRRGAAPRRRTIIRRSARGPPSPSLSPRSVWPRRTSNGCAGWSPIGSTPASSAIPKAWPRRCIGGWFSWRGDYAACPPAFKNDLRHRDQAEIGVAQGGGGAGAGHIDRVEPGPLDQPGGDAVIGTGRHHHAVAPHQIAKTGRLGHLCLLISLRGQAWRGHPRLCGRGTMRSMVEGACAAASPLRLASLATSPARGGGSS